MVRNEDCLRFLRSLAPQSVDAIITDPPYCSGAVSEAQRTKAKGQGLRSENISRFGWFVGGTIWDLEERALMAAYLATGRHRREILALSWENIDLEARRYYVSKSKAHLCKWYPINAAFLAVLEARKDRTGRVFKRWSHPDSVTHLVKRLLVGTGYPDLRLHDLRHSFASAYLNCGGDIYVLKELLGHSSLTTTMIYSHLTNNKMKEEAERVTHGIVAFA